jgi:GTPase
MNDQDQMKLNVMDLVIDTLYDRQNKKLIPEDDDRGNIEYKRRLDKKSTRSLNKMVMQMLTRMQRGHMENGILEAHYILGVDDNGEFSNLSKREVIITSKILRAVTSNASCKIISEKIYEFTTIDKKTLDELVSFVIHVHIKKDYKLNYIPESNIYLMGPTGVSKTSILSNLVYGQIDNMKGLSRKLSLRHAHEKKSGITSSTKYDTIGSDGNSIINYEISINYDMEAICEESSILFNVIDLPGDFKYSKTICHSLLTILPELIMICIPIIDAVKYIITNKEIYSMIFQICSVFDVEPLIVLTKSELIDNRDIKIMQNIKSDIITCLLVDFDNYNMDFLNIDIITVTNINNNGLDKMKEYLVNFGNDIINSIDDNEHTEHNENIKEGSNELQCKLLFRLNDAFEIPDIGTIYHGIMDRGSFQIGDNVSVICNGKIMERKIISIHRKSMDMNQLNKLETGSIMISGKCNKSLIDKTAVITDLNGIHHLTSIGKISSVNTNILEKQYLLFVGNNIVSVNIKKTDVLYIYSFKTCNSIDIIIDIDNKTSVPGILRDETNDLIFVKVYNF